MNDALISIKDLYKSFEIKTNIFSKEKISVKAVSGVTFDIKKRRNLRVSW